VAVHIRATVVSTPATDYAVIDGGSKTFPTDTVLNRPPLYAHSYGYVRGRDDLRLDRLSEEHGMLRTADGGSTGLQVGDVLEVIPFHICPAVNLQNVMYLLEDGVVRKLPVDARGMVV
jgi:D-serine deaminase-like pyridoxal phosphate-dependent protein